MLSSLRTALLAAALLSLSSSVSSAPAATASSSSDTCSTIASTTTIEVAKRFELPYTVEQAHYWSSSTVAIKPACIIFPKSAAEVSAIIKVLGQNNETFAVKSGGHSPNNYYASVSNGPLISTSKMNQVLLDQATGIVNIGPGNRLDEVAKKLDGTGWTFSGGRVGNVGVGGLVLNGGLSYLSAQYGWAASSVLEYEIVLADGTITTASASKNPDLFKALKGGGNNFGVVTAYITQAYKQGDIWGGNAVFLRSKDNDAKMLKAVRDFTEYCEDDKAAVIVTAERAVIGAVDSWILFLFYDGPSPPKEVFKNFTDIGAVLNTARKRSFSDMMAWSNWVVLPGVNVLGGTETIPLPSSANAETVLGDIHKHWRDITTANLGVGGFVASIAYQPVPKRIVQKARERSPDLIDMDDSVDRLIMEVNFMFLLPSDYDKMQGVMKETYSGIREKVVGWQGDGTLPDAYVPILMSYGNSQQDYFARLKPESRALAKSVANRVDPKGLFRDRTGGWKP